MHRLLVSTARHTFETESIHHYNWPRWRRAELVNSAGSISGVWNALWKNHSQCVVFELKFFWNEFHRIQQKLSQATERIANMCVGDNWPTKGEWKPLVRRAMLFAIFPAVKSIHNTGQRPGSRANGFAPSVTLWIMENFHDSLQMDDAQLCGCNRSLTLPVLRLTLSGWDVHFDDG